MPLLHSWSGWRTEACQLPDTQAAIQPAGVDCRSRLPEERAFVDPTIQAVSAAAQARSRLTACQSIVRPKPGSSVRYTIPFRTSAPP